MKLLILSNGSGEDRIGAAIAVAWQTLLPDSQIQALALVGQGQAYTEVGIDLLPPRFSPPSAGFAYLQPGLLWRDLRAGLLPHMYQSLLGLRQQRPDHVIAVGDIVPLLAALAVPEARKTFVACALSEYYLGDTLQAGRTVFDPLQRQILRRFQIPIFARDALSAQSLRRFGLMSHFRGNLMLDCVGSDQPPLPDFRCPVVGLLPGSHADAEANFHLLLQQLAPLGDQPLHFVLVQAPQVARSGLSQILAQAGWQARGAVWQRQQVSFSFWPAQSYKAVLQQAQVMVGLAGTANEQAVGYGVPVLSFAAAQASQYTWRFAEAQQRLLGAGLSFLGDPHPRLISWQLQRMLKHPTYRQQAQQIASTRFGLPGAVQQLVQSLVSGAAGEH